MITQIPFGRSIYPVIVKRYVFEVLLIILMDHHHKLYEKYYFSFQLFYLFHHLQSYLIEVFYR